MSGTLSRREALRAEMIEARQRTLSLLGQVPDAFLRRRVHDFYSPVGWHFGHIGCMEELWTAVETAGLEPLDAELSFLLTDRPDNPKDNRVSVPEREGLIAYLARVRERTFDLLDQHDDLFGWRFALEHECQHQETISEMLMLIQRSRIEELETPSESFPWLEGVSPHWVSIPGGTCRIGSPDSEGYDNEHPAFACEVDAFEACATLVTAYQWSEFIDAGGYLDSELWTPEGLAWVQDSGAAHPEFWVQRDQAWYAICADGLRPIHPDEPAGCLSAHEADAFAKWKRARLLTEFEWEYAAARAGGEFPWGGKWPDASRANHGITGGPSRVGSYPLGQSPDGLHDLAGNLWEWTSSAFLPYEGFVAYPYDGYSKDHMLGLHRVCRGGSWATSARLLRRSFRNWYVPTYRQGFLGMRLARGLG